MPTTTLHEVPIYHPNRKTAVYVTSLANLLVLKFLGHTVTFAVDRNEHRSDAIVMTVTCSLPGEALGLESRMPHGSVRLHDSNTSYLCASAANRWDRVLPPLGVEWLTNELRKALL